MTFIGAISPRPVGSTTRPTPSSTTIDHDADDTIDTEINNQAAASQPPRALDSGRICYSCGSPTDAVACPCLSIVCHRCWTAHHRMTCPVLGSHPDKSPAAKRARRDAFSLVQTEELWRQAEAEILPRFWFHALTRIEAVPSARLEPSLAALRSKARTGGTLFLVPRPLGTGSPPWNPSRALDRLLGVLPGVPIGSDQIISLGLRRFHQFMPADTMSPFPRLGSLAQFASQMALTSLLRHLLLVENFFEPRALFHVAIALTSTHHFSRAHRPSLLFAMALAIQVQPAGGVLADDEAAALPPEATRPRPSDESAAGNAASAATSSDGSIVAATCSTAAFDLSAEASHPCAASSAEEPASKRQRTDLDDAEAPMPDEPSDEDLIPPEEEWSSLLAAGVAAAAASTAAAGTELVSRKRLAEIRDEQRKALKAHKQEAKAAASAAASALAHGVHPPPDAPTALAVPAWAADFHESHSPFFVGGWIFCSTCGTRHTGKGSAAASLACRKDLESKSTQRYLTRTLRHGRMPKQLAIAAQWPDGLDIVTHPERPVYKLVRGEDGVWRFAVATGSEPAG